MSDLKFPKQLQNESFGFVKLRPKSKRPFEDGWPKKPYSFSEIKTWFSQGNNYGVQGGYADLVVVDCDTPETVDLIRNNLPNTFTVKTPSKGMHFYFKCSGIAKKIVLMKSGEHHGEVISFGSQVVGPHCIHPDTGTAYVIEHDAPIAEINRDDLLEKLKDYIPKPKNDVKEKSNSGSYSSTFQTLIEKFGEPYYVNKDHVLTSINQTFWAGLHNSEHVQIYEPDENAFYRYDETTGIYGNVTEHQIKAEISERMLAASRKTQLIGLEKKRTATLLGHIVNLLKGLSEKRNAFKKSSKFVHVANGVIFFNDDNEADFVPFSPKFMSRNFCPIAFDENAQCDRFLNDLLWPAVTKECALIIQKYMGLGLLGINLIQRLLILEGLPGGGKSTLALIIQMLIGQINVTELRTRHLNERFELYRYLKKTLLVGVDVPGRFLSEKGAFVIKGLVGGDWFDTEQKGGSGCFPMQGNFCLLITSNSRLQVKLDGDLGAWKRRLLICRFENLPPVKKIPNFADILIKEEGPGILNFALKGLSLLFEDIETYGDICMPESQANVVDALLAESDSLRHFLNDRVERRSDSDLSVTEIVESYAEYCPIKGWHAKPITVVQRELEGLMLERFQTSKGNSIKRYGKDVRGFRGVGFKSK